MTLIWTLKRLWCWVMISLNVIFKANKKNNTEGKSKNQKQMLVEMHKRKICLKWIFQIKDFIYILECKIQENYYKTLIPDSI